MLSIATTAASDTRILKACHEALAAESDFARKALFAGVLLLEKRQQLAPFSHSEKTGKFVEKKGGFVEWMKTSGVPVPTAYRWMDATEQVMRAQLGLKAHQDFAPVLEIEAEVAGEKPVLMPLSAALMLPDANLPAKAVALKQATFEFMGDRTLGEAAKAALAGDSDAMRVTRAKNGRKTGGTNEWDDRQAVDKYVATKLKNIVTHLTVRGKIGGRAWKHLPADKRAAIGAAFALAVESWPEWLLPIVGEKCRVELKLSGEERIARLVSKKGAL